MGGDGIVMGNWVTISARPTAPTALPTLVVGSEVGTRTLEQPLQRTKITLQAAVTLPAGYDATWLELWLSKDAGATWIDKGRYSVTGLTTNALVYDEYAPTATGSYKFKAVTGKNGAENQPSAATVSGAFVVAAIGLPGTNLISALALNTRTGAAWNGVTLEATPDGTPFWGLPDGIQITCGGTDSNAWYITFTARMVDASGNPAPAEQGGVESTHVQEFRYIPGAVYTAKNVDWWSFNPPSSVYTKVRFEFWGYRRPGASTADRVIQTLPGGLTYLDVTFGTPPSGAIDLGRAKPGTTLPGTQVTNVPGPSSGSMAIAVTITNGPTTPSGVLTYGWDGTITLPADLTNYNGCVLTQTWDAGTEGGVFQTLGPAQTAFHSDNFYPRASSTHSCVFKAYPISRDGVRGTAVSTTVSVTAGASYTLPGTQVTGTVPAATSATSATTAGYSTSAGSATSATTATTAGYSTSSGSAATVPGSGVTGAITAGSSGAGATVTVFQVKDTGGTVVMWAGNQGANYGIWAKNAWFGGSSPADAKIYMDSGGNAYFTGTVNSGSTVTGASLVGGSLSITTSTSTVTISGYTQGVEVTQAGGYLSRVAGSVLWTQCGSVYSALAYNSLLVGYGGTYSGLSTNQLIVGSVTCINTSQQWTGYGVYCPSYGVTCYSLTVGSGGMSVSGTISGTFSGTHSGTWPGSISPSSVYASGNVSASGFTCSGSAGNTVTLNIPGGFTASSDGYGITYHYLYLTGGLMTGKTG